MAHKSDMQTSAGPADDQGREPRFGQAERLLGLIKKSFENAQIRDFSEYVDSGPYYDRYWALKEDNNGHSREPGNDEEPYCVQFQLRSGSESILVIQQSDAAGAVSYFETSVLDLAVTLFVFAEEEMSDPGICKALKIKSESDKRKAVDEQVQQVLTRFLINLPVHLYQAEQQALRDSYDSYLSLKIAPQLRRNRKLKRTSGSQPYVPDLLKGLLRPSEEIFDRFRKSQRRRNPSMQPHRLALLSARYTLLSKLYGYVKKAYKGKKREFLQGSRRRTADMWRVEWAKEATPFQDLDPRCLKLLADDERIMPWQLALRHLGFELGYSHYHVKRLLTAAKKRERAKDPESNEAS